MKDILEKQYEFCKKYSRELALLQQIINMSLDKNKFALSIFCEYHQRWYDQILISNFSKHGKQDVAAKWLTQDILDTAKLVSTSSYSSIQLDVAVWIPRAFIIGPLSLSFIYINGLNLSWRHFLLILFADDTIFISWNDSVASLIDVLNDVFTCCLSVLVDEKAHAKYQEMQLHDSFETKINVIRNINHGIFFSSISCQILTSNYWSS